MFPETQSYDIFGLIVFGLGVALAGLVWLLAGSWLKARGRRWLALGLTGVAGLGAGAAYVLGEATWLWQPLLALAPVGLLLVLACSVVPSQVGRALHLLLGSAPVQAVLLLLGGLGLAGSQLWRMDE